MAYFLSPVFNESTDNDNGAPGSGWTLTTYLAGTTTLATVYKDSAGAAAHTNPIVLNARGEPPAPIWLLGGVAIKFVLKDDLGVTVRTIDDVSGTNDTADITPDEWLVFDGAPTFISATQFSLVGDQTTIFLVGRRVKSAITAGTGYHSVISSSFATTTTVTVNGTALDSGLSEVSYGLLTPTNGSIPGVSLSDGAWTFQNSVTFQKQVNEAQGADIASAATINLTLATGNLIDVTGTTTITAITLAQGAERTVRFTGALTLTHGASLVLPNAANIITAAGDFAIFRGYAAGVVRCVMYQKANLYIGPTRQVFTSGSGTYTTPARCTSINVRLIGGGGGGSGNNGASGNPGVATTFSTLTGGGGAQATGGGTSGGAGGTATGGDFNIPGGSGGSGSTSPAGANIPGGDGGNGFFGGGGGGGGLSGATNSGGGGGGGSGAASTNGGGGGGSGGYCEKRINSPAATYSYAVGTGGTGSSGSPNAGGAGAAGIIIVDEIY